jgi:hypothetical protein
MGRHSDTEDFDDEGFEDDLNLQSDNIDIP